MQKYKRILFVLLLIIAVPTLSACNAKNISPASENDQPKGELNTEKEKLSQNNTEKTDQSIKEFSMTSFTEIIDGQYFPQFSTKEITVNKGDLVRIKVTTTSGEHSFKIDEFNVFSETPLNEETVIEFVAAKSGEFIYYCDKTGHRAKGHWGTLKVLE